MKAHLIALLSLTLLSTPCLADVGENIVDPFSDYNEFVEARQEEEDLNYFRSGRMLSLYALGGYRGLTGNLREYYDDGFLFGGGLSFFPSLNSAMDILYTSSLHNLFIELPASATVNDIRGSMNLEFLTFRYRYFLKSESLLPVISNINPHIILGGSFVFKSLQDESQSLLASKEQTFSFEGGFGFEVLFNKKKNYVGLQGVYQYVPFPNENTELSVSGASSTGIFLSGDTFTLSAQLGYNF